MLDYAMHTMDDSGYILYELARDCIGMRIAELSAQLAHARHQSIPDHVLIAELKRRSSTLWMERHELSWRDDAAIEACLLTHSAHPDRALALIAQLKRRKAENEIRVD